MKKITILIAIFCLSVTTMIAQSPEGFKYQAVVRNSSNEIISNQSIGIQMSILQGSSVGTAVYTEVFTPTSNAYGLVNLEIGTGTTSDDFALIDWANGSFFIETSMDVSGGVNYVVMGTSQLMSVPYALHAKTAENTFSGDYIDLVNQPDMSNFDQNVLDDFDGQYTSLVGAPSNVSSFTNDAGYLTSFTEIDGSITNEIQALSISNDTIFLENGGFVKLPLSVDTSQALQFLNGWNNLGSGWSTAEFYKDRERVYLQGVITGSVNLPGTLIGMLPIGYRPTNSLLFITASASSTGFTKIGISSSGQIRIEDNSMPTWIALGNMSFR